MNEAALEQVVSTLAENRARWATLPIRRRIRYLEQIRRRTGRVATDWVAAAGAAKGLAAGSPLLGEEWSSGPYAVVYTVNRYIETLDALAKGRDWINRERVHTRPDGRVVVEVFPQRWTDRILFSGIRAEVWLPSGTNEEALERETAAFYRRPSDDGALTLVLGAGNIASIPILDVLYKMMVEKQVCLLKVNPVNDYLTGYFETILGPLIEDGFAAIVRGGAEVGERLIHHPAVDTIHITGSEQTHDAIVYGGGAAGEARRARGEPLLAKPISSELGNVSPTIVVPGPWSDKDLQFQAEHIATQKFHNGGFNCVATQVLVLPAGWSRTADLVERLQLTMRAIPPRHPYYPGAASRLAAAAQSAARVETLDVNLAGQGSRLLLHDLDPTSPQGAFSDEFFSSALAWTQLPGRDAGEFLEAAVQFANGTLHGTLGANLIVHPETMATHEAALDRAIASLRYGTVAVNAWTGVGYSIAQCSWGAFPGHTLDNIQSGRGIVHNALFFDRPEKSVVYGPFAPFPRSLTLGERHLLPKPPWFVTHARGAEVMRRLFEFEMDPGASHLPGIILSALRDSDDGSAPPVGGPGPAAPERLT